MKKIYLALKMAMICVLSILFSSCSKNSIIEADDATQKNDIELLRQLGYETKGMIEQDEYYMIYPNFIVSKSRLDEIRNTPETRMQQNPSTGLLSEANRTVYLKDSKLSYLKYELEQAIEAWNSIGNTGLKFVINNNEYKAVEMYAEYDGDTGLDPIQVEAPSSKGDYGRYVRINLTKLHNVAFNYGMGKDLMMHVLGHIVGFAHTASNTLISPPQGHINGTTYNDPASIMRSENDILKGFTWKGFSSNDIFAIRKVYPHIEASSSITISLSGTEIKEDKLELYKTYSITAKYTHPSCPNPNYEISIIQSNGYAIQSIKNGLSSLCFYVGGSYTIEVKITNSSDKFTFYKNVTLPLDPAITNISCTPEPGGVNNNELTLNTNYQFSATYSQTACPNPVYKISIDKTKGYVLTPVNNNTISVRFQNSGTYRVIVEITNAPITTKFEKTYVIPATPAITSIICTPAGDGVDENELFFNYTYQITANYSQEECPNPQYNITIDKTSGYELTSIENGKVSIRFSTPGTYKVMVTVTNANVSPKFERTFIVPEKRPWIRVSCPTKVELNKNLDFYLNTTSDFNDSKYEYTITVLETTFNDPQYTLTKISKNNVSICFKEPGNYVVEARIENAPQVATGKCFVSVFGNPKCIMNTGSVGQVDGLEEFYTYLSIYDDMNELNIPYRHVFYTQTNKWTLFIFDHPVSSPDPDLYEPKLGTPSAKIQHTFRKGDHPIIKLPNLKEWYINDPYVGRMFLCSPFYIITYPENSSQTFIPYNN